MEHFLWLQKFYTKVILGWENRFSQSSIIVYSNCFVRYQTDHSLSNRLFVMEYRLFIIVFIYSPLILWVWYIGRNVIIHPINPSRERSRSNNNLCCEHVVLETPYGGLNYTWSASGIYVVLDAILHFDHNEELYLCLGNFSITRSIYF